MLGFIKELIPLGKKNNNGEVDKTSVQRVVPFLGWADFPKFKDGFYRAYLSITPVNSNNLTTEDMDDVVEHLQEILNADPGHIHIKVSAEPMNMEAYEEYVEDIANQASNAYTLQRIQNYADYVQQRKDKAKNQKRFYMILRSVYNDEKLAHEELANKVLVIKEILESRDMKGILMKRSQIRDLIYRKMNPNLSQLQPYDDVMTDNDILPAAIVYQQTQTYVDGMYYRHFLISHYPNGQKEACWFKKILDAKGNIELDIFLSPGDPTDVEKGISNSISTLETRLEEKLPPYKRSKYIREKESLETQLEEIQDNTAYDVVTMVTIYDSNLEQLERQSKMIQSVIRSIRMRSKSLAHRYLDPYLLHLPLCIDSPILKKFGWQMHSKIVASMMPFDSSEITGNTGVIWGYNPDTEDFIIIDRFDRTKYNNGNGVTFGGSGSGKTFANMTEIDRNLFLGITNREVIVDPEREYKFEYGSRINFEVGGNYCTNPFYFRSYVLDADEDDKDGEVHAGKFMLRKTTDMIGWLKWIYPGMDPEESSVASKVIRRCFEFHGLTDKTEDLKAGYEPPVLDTFERFAKEESKLETLLNIMDPYIHGEYKSLFNGQTNWDLADKLTVLDIFDLQEEIQKPLYDLILKDVWTDFKRDRNERAGFRCDEAHRLVNKKDPQAQTLQFIVNCYKRFRKYEKFIEIMTQNIDDILSVGPEYATQILANSTFKRYLYMKKNDWEALQKIETLSKKELGVIKKKVQQGRGIIIAEDQRAFFQSEASLDQLKFIAPKRYAQIMQADIEEVGDEEGEAS